MSQPPNGNSKPSVPAVSLPAYRLDAMRASNEYHQQREHLLEETYHELAEAKVVISELEAELEAMKRERVMLESRATSCLIERDRAKDDQVRLSTIINAAQRLFADEGVPTLDEQAKLRALAQEVEAEG